MGWKVVTCRDGDRIVLATGDDRETITIEISVYRNNLRASIAAPEDVGISHTPRQAKPGYPRFK